MRRLFEVKVFDGDKEDQDTKVVTETVVAWNELDAMRRCGGRDIAERPKAVCFVTWEEDSGALYRIEDTAGPTDEIVEPTIAPVDDGWGNPEPKEETESKKGVKKPKSKGGKTK